MEIADFGALEDMGPKRERFNVFGDPEELAEDTEEGQEDDGVLLSQDEEFDLF